MARLKILALNAGSSSLKASLFELSAPGREGDPPMGQLWEAESEDGNESLEQLLGGVVQADVIGHRVVHGGASLVDSVLVTAAVRAEIARVAEYAPAHNAAALRLMDAATRVFGEHVPQVAVFDTAFHQTMPPAAFTYAGPYAWLAQGIRRYGFHGISHQYASHRAARLLDRAQGDLRVVSCHLGSGCSLAAVRGGQSVDTTMGFTPLDGIPMARRSGAVDPGILIHLLRHGGETVDSLDRMLNHDSGLAGLSGTSGDMRHVLAAASAGDDRSQLAFDVFVHRTCQGIASMAASMGGVDTIVFTGGVGEHAPRVRAEICASLGFLGVSLDPGRNATCHSDGDISDQLSPTRVLVVRAQENWMVARECVRIARVAPGN
ncbi:MAG: acetate/propionate family kinase [Gemmatimonadaceae bacterium]